MNKTISNIKIYNSLELTYWAVLSIASDNLYKAKSPMTLSECEECLRVLLFLEFNLKKIKKTAKELFISQNPTSDVFKSIVDFKLKEMNSKYRLGSKK